MDKQETFYDRVKRQRDQYSARVAELEEQLKTMTEAICFAITQYEEQGFIDIDSHERIEEAMKKQALEDE